MNISRRTCGVALLASLVCFTNSFVIPSICTRMNLHNDLRSTTKQILFDSSIDEYEGESQKTGKKDARMISRRNALLVSSGVLLSCQNANALPSLFPSSSSSSVPEFTPASRPLTYLVDSTIPPTLIPFRGARKEAAILKNLGLGMGTPKAPFLDDRVNLNNMMKKGVDSIAAQSGGVTNRIDLPGYASFVFLGMDYTDAQDTSLASTLISQMIQSRKASDDNTALGLEFCPLSLQSKLDQYTSNNKNGGGMSESELVDAMVQAGVDPTIATNQIPLYELAKSKQLKLLALSPEKEDIQTVQTQGLQNVDPQRRSQYVIDAQGFIEQTQDPFFKLYTEKSLLRTYVESNTTKVSDFFAERILVHETVATAISKYAVFHPKSLVITVAPIQDVRYMGGPNGRIERISHVLSPECSIDDQSITTILLNPSAEETLSKSKFLRLEIGTSPDNRAYQTKIADYLWFSTMPKVNMLPRMMNGA